MGWISTGARRLKPTRGAGRRSADASVAHVADARAAHLEDAEIRAWLSLGWGDKRRPGTPPCGLFRQAERGAWRSVFAEMAMALGPVVADSFHLPGKSG